MIVEPVAGNMGCVPPAPGSSRGCASSAPRRGALLIFDEVMTGFRVARGGAQELYGVAPRPDLLGKIIGGGLPVGAYGGRGDVMEQRRAARARLPGRHAVGQPAGDGRRPRDAATPRGRRGPTSGSRHARRALEAGLARGRGGPGVALCVNRVGSMLTLFFTDGPVRDYDDARRRRTRSASRAFFRAMLRAGVYLAPSQFEAAFVSLAHGPDEVELTLAAARDALAR